MANQKYRLLEDDTIVREGRKLYRIQALRHVTEKVEARTLGGYIESEANLSDKGESWVFENACAYEEARVEDHARLCDQATLRGKARLRRTATMHDQAIAQDEAMIEGDILLLGHAVVRGRAKIKGCVRITDFVQVGDHARVEGEESRGLWITGTTMILGNTVMQGAGFFSEEEAILEAGSFLVEEEED